MTDASSKGREARDVAFTVGLSTEREFQGKSGSWQSSSQDGLDLDW